MSQDDRLTGLIGYSGVKIPVRVATAANITLSGLQTIDGVVVASGDRVLAKNQTSSVDNGIYVADSGTWERAHDCDGSYDLTKGSVVRVTDGTANVGFWYCTSANPVVVGTDAVTWALVGSGLSDASAFALTLLNDVDAAAMLTTLGVSGFIQTLVNDAAATDARTTLGLVIGTDVQAYDPDLASIASAGISPFVLTLIDDLTASAFLTTLGFTTFVKTLLDDATAADFITTLGFTATLDELNGLDASAKVRVFDDGTDAHAGSIWSYAFGGADSAVSGLAQIDGQNGVVRMTTGAGAGATMAANGLSYMGPLMWKANGGSLVFEQKIKLSAITNVCVFLGFTDQVTALEMPFTLAAGDALTSNASDAVGVLFDTGADTDNWWLVGVAADVDAIKQNAGVAPVAGTDETWRIELSTTGVASFFRNGVAIGTAMAGSVTPSVFIAHTLNAFARAAGSRDVSYDYTLIQGNRA